MNKGRPPLGPELVEQLDGSDPAKQRLKVILQTLAREKTVTEACVELGVSESRFYELRSEWLQQSLVPLEPKPLGRPKPVLTPEQAQIEELRELVKKLEKELVRSQVKEELALSVPQLFQGPSGMNLRWKPLKKRPWPSISRLPGWPADRAQPAPTTRRNLAHEGST